MSKGPKSHTPRWGLTTLLYVIFLLPSLYALAAIIELDFLMGHGTGTYSDYGRNAGQAALAIAFTVLYALWVTFGTIIAIRVFKGQLGLRSLGLLAAVAIFMMFPVAAVFLLGVGHL